jgi:hypothetical protein
MRDQGVCVMGRQVSRYRDVSFHGVAPSNGCRGRECGKQVSPYTTTNKRSQSRKNDFKSVNTNIVIKTGVERKGIEKGMRWY